MSAHIVAAKDLNVNVRCTRESEANRGEEEEYQVIFNGFLEDNEHHTDPGSLKARPNTQKTPAAVNRVSFRTAAVVLGVIYLLILAGIFIRYVLVSLEKYQLQTSYDKLSNNYTQLQEKNSVNNNQLQKSYETLSKNYSQIQTEEKQLRVKMSDMTVNNSQMKSSYETLRTNYNQLQDEIKQLKDKIEGMWCPEEWKKFGLSCYFKSNQKKTWYNSRSDCQSKGADLVVINNKEEQKFLTELNVDGEFWIGLHKSWKSGRWVWEWEWVDGSPLTEMFRESGLPQYSAQQYRAATCCDQQGRWTHRNNYDSNHWICEK